VKNIKENGRMGKNMDRELILTLMEESMWEVGKIGIIGKEHHTIKTEKYYGNIRLV